MLLKAELQFDLANISEEIDRSKELVETQFSDKIRIIIDLIGTQAKLVGMYTNQIFARKHSMSKYKENGNIGYRASELSLS